MKDSGIGGWLRIPNTEGNGGNPPGIANGGEGVREYMSEGESSLGGVDAAEVSLS